MEETKTNKNVKNNFGKWGWITILFCAIAMFFSAMFGLDGLNIFLTPLSEQNGFDPAFLLKFNTYGGWIGIILLFILGKVIKDRGAKIVLVATMGISAILFIALGQTTSPVAAAAVIAVMSALNAGYASLCPNTLINNWFPRKKGLALGWSTMGLPLATLLCGPLLGALMSAAGTSNMFIIIGAVAIVLLIAFVVLVRNTPEERGVLPDNMTAEEAAALPETEGTHATMTMLQVLAKKQTWLIGIGMGLPWLVTATVVSQMVPHLIINGYAPPKAIGMMTIIGVCGLFGSYIWGWLDQKFNTKIICNAYAIWYLAALLLLIFFTRSVLIYVALCMCGLCVGGIANLVPSLIGSTYGRKEFSAAMPVVMAITSTILSAASLLNGISLDLCGDYYAAYYICIALCVISVVLVRFVKPITDK